LADNLKHLEGGNDDDSSENGEMSDEEFGEDNEEEEFKNIKAKIQQFKDGKCANSESEDDDDSDYDPDFDGDMELYDSCLDEVDELLYLKETFEILHSHKPDYYTHLISKCDAAKLQQCITVLGNAKDLKDREAKCLERMEAFENLHRCKRSAEKDLF
jgi:hypothetical protein